MDPSSLGKNISLDYSKKEILQELERILSSELFSRTVVLSNFLKFIVDETLHGNTEKLKEYTIAVCALGKSSDFDPKSNAIVRINAGRLRRLLNEYYIGPGISDELRIEIVKGTYVPLFRAHVISNPGTVIKVESKTGTPPGKVTFSRSKLTLAILPFRNLLPNDEFQFFVNGFGEELTQIFSTSEDIAVVSHFSTLKYATRMEDIRVIGAELGVHYLITGSVKRSSKLIKVSVGLIETVNGIQIWSKDYAHDLGKDRIMEIQNMISDDVFAILSGHYGFIMSDTMRLVEDDMKKDLQTFDAILWFYHTELTHSEADYVESKRGLDKILENDPNNAMCLVVLGDLYLAAYAFGYTTVENPVHEAHKLITKALRIAPSSQYAHIIHGWANIYLGKKKEAIDALEYGWELATPSPSTKGALGFAFACAGEYLRGRTLLHEALNLNPFCPWWYYMGFFLGYYKDENYEEALSYTQKMRASADVYHIPLLMASAKGQLGLIDDARTEVNVLNENFQAIMTNLEIYLSAFILDETLVEEIMVGAQKAGVTLV